jgi:hypothetical protein
LGYRLEEELFSGEEDVHEVVELSLGKELPKLHEDDGVLEFTPLYVKVKERVYQRGVDTLKGVLLPLLESFLELVHFFIPEMLQEVLTGYIE